jgi:hypothetical protein
MSFLETDDDRLALEEALRFIDEFGLTPDAIELPGSSAPTGSNSVETGGRKHPKRIRDPAVYTRRRSKQKSEMVELRQQAKSLERQILMLRRARRLSDSGGSSDIKSETHVGSMRRAKHRDVAWLMAAASEQCRRQIAEFTNAQLRQALAAQWAASRSLLERVGELSDLAVSTPLYMNHSLCWLTLMRCVLASQQVEIEHHLSRFLVCSRAARMAPSRPIGDDFVVADMSSQLLATAQRLVLEARSSQGSAVRAVTNEYNIKHDPDVGMYAEARGAAPLGGNAENTLAYMQDRLCTMKFPPHSAIRSAVMVRFTAASYVRTVDTDRVRCVWADDHAQEARVRGLRTAGFVRAVLGRQRPPPVERCGLPCVCVQHAVLPPQRQHVRARRRLVRRAEVARECSERVRVPQLQPNRTRRHKRSVSTGRSGHPRRPVAGDGCAGRGEQATAPGCAAQPAAGGWPC